MIEQAYACGAKPLPAAREEGMVYLNSYIHFTYYQRIW